MAAFIQDRLTGLQGITRVSASIATGNVLVLHTATHTAEAVGLAIQKLILDFHKDPGTRRHGRGTATRPLSRKGGGQPSLEVTKVAPWAAASWDRMAAPPWHTMDPEEVIRHYKTSRRKGLTEASVKRRRAQYGINVLPGTFVRSFGEIFKGQATSPPVLLIGAAAGLSLLTGGVIEGLVGLGVALINATIASTVERRAERALETIRESVDLRARVIRNGELSEISFEDFVPGDILDLEVGSRVPADARLIESDYLSVDEATLTGESVPVRKSLPGISRKDLPISRRRNMVYRGTLVVEGSGRAVVVATGDATVLGRLQGFLGEVFPPEAAMAQGLKRISRKLIFMGLGASSLLGLTSLIRGYGLLRAVRDSVAFIAWSLPSGLSTLALGAFALGHQEMRKNAILVRRLRAMGNLASVGVVCFDKTGTLTRNRMTVTELRAGTTRASVGKDMPLGKALHPAQAASGDIPWLITLSALCNETAIIDRVTERSLEGSSTEKAMIDLAVENGLDLISLRKDHPLVEIHHRTDEHPFMVTLHRWRGHQGLTIMKGSPPEVMERCSMLQQDGQVLPLTDDLRRYVEQDNFAMAGAGLRVLGVAYRWGRCEREGCEEDWQLTWAGLLGLSDPVRDKAAKVVRTLHRAGIKTAVITGDQSLTAQHIGEDLGLSGGEPLRILDAADLKGAGARHLKSLVTRTHVFARLSPTQKLEIIQAYQSTGVGVVMVGDGVNDVLALKVADVGMAMGRDGAELARRTADLVLEDDDLEGVVLAIAAGRAFYENMSKSVRYLLTASHVDTILETASRSGMAAAGPSAWHNLWTNLICLGFILEAPGPTVLTRPPLEASESLFMGKDIPDTSKDVLKILAGSSPVGLYGLLRYGGGHEAGRLFSRGVSIAEMLYADACRGPSPKRDPKGPGNPLLQTTILGVIGAQFLSVILGGLGKSPGAAALRALDVLILGASGLLSRLLFKMRL
jgi:Ca2+-transporting ATPase